MDLFSPERGAGLAVRCDDADGRHKVVALRKFIPGEAEIDGDVARTPTAEEFKWTNSLDAVPGIGPKRAKALMKEEDALFARFRALRDRLGLDP